MASLPPWDRRAYLAQMFNSPERQAFIAKTMAETERILREGGRKGPPRRTGLDHMRSFLDRNWDRTPGVAEAVHEAAHALLCAVYGIGFNDVRLYRDGSQHVGRVTVHASNGGCHRWQLLDMSLAGAAAQSKFTFKRCVPSGGDRHYIDRNVNGADPLTNRRTAENRVGRLLEEHWRHVVYLAKELWLRHELNASTVRDMLRKRGLDIRFAWPGKCEHAQRAG